MRKLKFGSIVLSTALICSTQVNAYTLELKQDKNEILAGDKIVVTVKMNDLDEMIDTYQAKLVYDSNDFKKVTSSDFNLKSGWEGLVYNQENGMFVVEKQEKTKQSEDVLSITLESQKEINKEKISVSLIENAISGGKSDITTADVDVEIDVIKKYGYEILEEKFVGPVKPKTPVMEFKNIFTGNTGIDVVVKENNKIIDSGYMKTGMIVEITENNEKKQYEIFVIGDPNGDGIANSADTRMIKAYRNELLSLDTANFKAADINNDGEVNIKDSKLLLYHRADVKGYNLNYSK